MAKAKDPAPGWWAQRWTAFIADQVLRRRPEPTRLRGAARAQTRIGFHKGRVEATVGTGNFASTFYVSLRVRTLTTRDWRTALAAICRQPEVAHKLLSGTPGPELETALAGAGLALFPEADAVRSFACSCREPGACRHRLALLVHTAGLLDANPFLWLAVLGQERAEVLAALRAGLADNGQGVGGTGTARPPGGAADLAADPERFWSAPADAAAIPVRPGHSAAPDALLRLLGPLPAEVGRVGANVEQEITRGQTSWKTWKQEEYPVQEWLRRYAAHIGQAAAELARGERQPRYLELPPVGKPLPLRARLATEVADAARQADEPLSIPQLAAVCPTAAALPEAQAEGVLRHAVTVLPPDLLALTRWYVGRPAAFLAGAAFRHVITFGEWRAGRLSADADWWRALSLTGAAPPFWVQAGAHRCRLSDPADPPADEPGTESLWGLLQPEVGDELWLTVDDPDVPVLTAALRRRSQRGLGAARAQDVAAVAALIKHMSALDVRTLTEQDAVAALLGQGCYRPEQAPDPVWLLPRPGERRIFLQGPDRQISQNDYQAWQPIWRRYFWSDWRARDGVLTQFVMSLASRGEPRQRLEAAQKAMALWCRAWPGVQDSPDAAVPLAVLLHFLWNVAPLEARRWGVRPEWVPEFLALWFTYLVERQPTLRDIYADHLVACGRRDLHAWRLQTLPRSRDRADTEMGDWEVEAYRWLGPGLYFA